MKSREVERLTHSLIRYAARTAPVDLAARLEEEWLADLAAQPAAFGRLRFALGCCWATRVIAHEYPVGGLATATTAGSKTLAALVPTPSSFYSSRTTVLLIIAGLHVILIYSLAIGLGHDLIKPSPPVIRGVVVEKAPRPDVAPSRPDLSLKSWNIKLAPIHVDPLAPVETDPGTTTAASSVVDPPEPTLGTPKLNRVLGGPGQGFPNTDDYYPQTSRRLGEHGAVVVQVCVDERGKLISQPTIVDTSGSASLDQGGLKLAKDGSGHYRSTTEDGRAVNSCYPFRVRFELRQ